MRLSATCDGRAESDAGISEKTELISMHGVALQSQGSQCVFKLQGDFLFVKFDSRLMES